MPRSFQFKLADSEYVEAGELGTEIRTRSHRDGSSAPRARGGSHAGSPSPRGLARVTLLEPRGSGPPGVHTGPVSVRV